MVKIALKFVKVSTIVIVVIILTIFLFMQQASFGRLPKGARLSRVESSPYHKNGKFQNIEPTNTIAKGVSYVGMMIDFFKKAAGREPVTTIAAIKTDLNKLDGDKPIIVWFGHSSYLIHINNRNILVDPIFSERASPVSFAGSKSYLGTRIYSEKDLPHIDAVVISHDHYDHLDYPTIVALKEKVKLFCVPLGVGAHLSHWGVDEKHIVELDWWGSASILPGFELIATPARHFSGRGLTRDKTLWCSYVLKTDSHNLFIGGDSGYDNTFKQIGTKYGPFDIALLECGQYDVKWPNIHMMPEETVQASIDLQAKVLMPVHWGKFTLGLHPWIEPIERASKEAIRLNVTLTTPRIGEPVVLGLPLPNDSWWNEVTPAAVNIELKVSDEKEVN